MIKNPFSFCKFQRAAGATSFLSALVPVLAAMTAASPTQAHAYVPATSLASCMPKACGNEPAAADPSAPAPVKTACCSTVNEEDFELEAKVGYFFFSDSKMRKIYDEGGWDTQLSASYPVYTWLQIYGSAEYLEKHGKSLSGGEKTSIWEVPLSLGLKPIFTITSYARYYFTLGPRYIFFHAHNDSSYVDRHVSRSGLGGFVNTGFNFYPTEYLLIDVFGEYSYKKMHFHTSKTNVFAESAQIGGFVFGVGLGYVF